MTIDRFIEDEHAQLEVFKAWWKANAAKGETDEDGNQPFPDEMSQEDWFEQYIFFFTL